MTHFSVARLEEIQEVDDGRCPFRPIRAHFGISTFGVTTVSSDEAGRRLINEHDESEPGSSEELYVVIAGRARFQCDGVSRDAPAGTFVHVPAGVRRTAYAEQADTTILCVGAAPEGQPYQASGWELFAPLLPLVRAERYEEAAQRAQELIAEDPPYPALYFNAACLESRAGRMQDALVHLRRAIELAPQWTQAARDDEDLAALREAEPDAFAALVGQ